VVSKSRTGDPHRSWVTFVWRGDKQTRSVGLAGGPAPLLGRTPLTRLADTDLWYRTENIRNDARFVYCGRTGSRHELTCEPTTRCNRPRPCYRLSEHHCRASGPGR
jgi:hypothetical protein